MGSTPPRAACAASESSAPEAGSIGFAESSFDELSAARVVAERFGTDHHELVIRPGRRRAAAAPGRGVRQPIADSVPALPAYLVSELAAGSVKVALSGEGGDDLFGGFHTYVADQDRAPAWRPPRRRCGGLSADSPARPAKVSLDYKAKRFVRGAHPPPVESDIKPGRKYPAQTLQAELVSPPGETESQIPSTCIAPTSGSPTGAEPLARLQDLDLRSAKRRWTTCW